MQISRDDIILIIVVLTATFLVVGIFFLSYITLYNQRKKKNYLQKMAMQKEFEQELIKTQMEVQEHTLQTIASDIHDNVGQLLGITKLTLSSIPVNSVDEKNAGKLSSAKELLDNAITELRQMATLLHAENILADGLSHAIGREADRLVKSGNLEVCYSVHGQPFNPLSKQAELVVYRITQELLHNIIKHADATFITISLTFTEEAVTLFVSDDGKGFSVNKTKENSQGMGMQTLFQRAVMIGAQLQLDSEEQKGTKATLHIPYQNKTNHERTAY